MSVILLVRGERVLGRAALGAVRLKLKDDGSTALVYLRRVLLPEELIRDFVARTALPYIVFQGVDLRGPHGFCFPASFIWGELGVYRNGDPAIHDMILVPGFIHGIPGPELAQAAMSWLPVVRAQPNPYEEQEDL